MSSEHRNRTNKAQAIAAALVTVGMPADGMLDEAGWRIAALAGWHIAKAEGVDGIAAEPWTTVSDATRTEVRRLLAADEARRAEDAEGLTAHRTDDVFASIAAGSALPRPAQDPDAPIPTAADDTDWAADDAQVDAILDAPVSTREWLAGVNYGALPTESWD